jgi:hypothetical protein
MYWHGRACSRHRSRARSTSGCMVRRSAWRGSFGMRDARGLPCLLYSLCSSYADAAPGKMFMSLRISPCCGSSFTLPLLPMTLGALDPPSRQQPYKVCLYDIVFVQRNSAGATGRVHIAGPSKRTPTRRSVSARQSASDSLRHPRRACLPSLGRCPFPCCVLSGCGAEPEMKTRRAPVPCYAMHLALVDQLDAVNEEALLAGRVRAMRPAGLNTGRDERCAGGSNLRMRYSRALCLTRQTVCRRA